LHFIGTQFLMGDAYLTLNVQIRLRQILNDGVYSFAAKEVYSIIYQAYSENRNLFIYGNNCANGSPATRFAIR